MKHHERMRLDFGGLRAAPSQAVGTVRLVPLVRDEPIEGLRLYAVPTGADLTVVKLDPRTAYTAYVPHALVAELPGSKQAHASAGTQLVRARATPEDVFRVQVTQRLSRREGDQSHSPALALVVVHSGRRLVLDLDQPQAVRALIEVKAAAAPGREPGASRLSAQPASQK